MASSRPEWFSSLENHFPATRIHLSSPNFCFVFSPLQWAGQVFTVVVKPAPTLGAAYSCENLVLPLLKSSQEPRAVPPAGRGGGGGEDRVLLRDARRLERPSFQ